MAPSSSDILGQDLSNGAMDFQPSTFGAEPQTQAASHQQAQSTEPIPQLHMLDQQQSAHTLPHSQTDHPFLQLFSSEPQHQSEHQYHQQDSQHPSPPQYQSVSQQQQLGGETHQSQSAFATDSSSEQQHPQLDTSTGMANSRPAARSSASPPQPQPTQQSNTNAGPSQDPEFDIFDWYPKYQSCQRYFIDHAQQSAHVQAVAAFINIALPLQRASNPIPPAPSRSPPSLANPPQPLPHQLPSSVSLIPYLRRLVVTGLDYPGVLHGFFGDDWVPGVGPLHEQERRNYLFAAKSGGWASVKKDYDMSPLETVPFMRPLQGPVIVEIEAAEKSWSEWLAMEDWMVGPRAPEAHRREGGGGGGGAGGQQREGLRR